MRERSKIITWAFGGTWKPMEIRLLSLVFAHLPENVPHNEKLHHSWHKCNLSPTILSLKSSQPSLSLSLSLSLSPPGCVFPHLCSLFLLSPSISLYLDSAILSTLFVLNKAKKLKGQSSGECLCVCVCVCTDP